MKITLKKEFIPVSYFTVLSVASLFANTTVTLENANGVSEHSSAPIDISLRNNNENTSVSISGSAGSQAENPSSPITLSKPAFNQDVSSSTVKTEINPPVEEKLEPVASPKSSNQSDGFSYLMPADSAEQKSVSRGGEKLPVRPEQLQYKNLQRSVPEVSKVVLPNGIRVFHYESKDLPRVQIQFLLNAGSNLDPEAKVGLAALTANSLRAGGTEDIAPDEFDQKLDFLGSDFTLSADRESVAGQIYFLTRNTDATMELVKKILLTPRFEAKKFQQEKDKVSENLRRQNDEPDELSRREFRKIVYGKDAVLARTVSSSTLEALTPESAKEFYNTYYCPSSLWVGVSGDISKDDAVKLIDKYFGEWKKSAPALPDLASLDVQEVTSGGVFLTEKETAQSQIRIGELGLVRKSPDAYAANVFNSIYGTGGFSSRLMNRVRTKNGFAYGVGGGLMSDTPKGLFAVVAGTQSGKTVAAIKEILDVTKESLEQPPTPQELDIAKKDTISSFYTQFSTPKNIVSVHLLYDYRGYADDYLKTFADKIQAVTAEQVLDVAKKYINPAEFKIYVVGQSKDFDAPLDSLGKVENWTSSQY